MVCLHQGVGYTWKIIPRQILNSVQTLLQQKSGTTERAKTLYTNAVHFTMVFTGNTKLKRSSSEKRQTAASDLGDIQENNKAFLHRTA